MSLLMIVIAINTACVMAERDPQVQRSRGGVGAAGQPEKSSEGGPQGAGDRQQIAKITPNLQQLSQATWRKKLNGIEYTEAPDQGAHGDIKFAAWGGLYGTREGPEKPGSAHIAETPTAGDCARDYRANGDNSKDEKLDENLIPNVKGQGSLPNYRSFNMSRTRTEQRGATQQQSKRCAAAAPPWLQVGAEGGQGKVMGGMHQQGRERPNKNAKNWQQSRGSAEGHSDEEWKGQGQHSATAMESRRQEAGGEGEGGVEVMEGRGTRGRSDTARTGAEKDSKGRYGRHKHTEGHDERVTPPERNTHAEHEHRRGERRRKGEQQLAKEGKRTVGGGGEDCNRDQRDGGEDEGRQRD